MNKERPLLRLLAMMVAGIVVGHYVDVTWSYKWWGVTALLLLPTAVMFRQKGRVASLILLAAAMLMGVFIVRKEPLARPSDLGEGYAVVVQEKLRGVRHELSQVYAEQGLEGVEYSVVAAMTLGEKNGLDGELKEVYRVSGASHVFALSGLHLGILFMIMTYVLPVRRWPKGCLVIELLGLWMYVLMVGCGASVVRAAVMLSVYGLASTASRKPDSISVLLFTAGLMLVVKPLWLFDIGFQMSFMAVACIVVMYKPLYYALPVRQPVIQWLWGLTVLSLVAQIGVAPLVAHYFHRFSCYFLLTNYIVSPGALIIIVLAMVLMACVAIACVMPWMGFMATCVAKALTAVVQLQNDLLLQITKMPYASVDGIRLNAIQTVLVYVLIFCVITLLVKIYRKILLSAKRKKSV